MTARWVVDEVAPARDLRITWQPISLLFKNEPEPDSPFYERLMITHNLLRVIESARAAGLDPQPLYWEFGRRIHHDGEQGELDLDDVLETVGYDVTHATAYGDPGWDDEIRTRMDRGLALAGTDIGTPIIAFTNSKGHEAAYFGPVITRVPPTEDSLRMWDALVTMMDIDGFWELKRTRTETPEFGERP